MGSWERVFLGSEKHCSSCGLPGTHRAYRRDTFQVEDPVNVHLEGETPRHCSWRFCSKNLFLFSNMCFVVSATSLPTPLPGTKPPHGTVAQHKGKRKLLSSSISLVILGGQFSTELVSRIQSTFSYVERE